MYVFFFLFIWILSTSLEAAPPHDELVDTIMKTARRNLSVQKNVGMLKHLVYEQDFTNLQATHVNANANQKAGISSVDAERPNLVSSLLHLFNMERSGFVSEISEGNKRRDKFFNYLIDLYNEFPLIRIGYKPIPKFAPDTGYVTLCFHILKDYHHPVLVFEYPGFGGSVDAALCHLAYGEDLEFCSGEKKRKEAYRVYYQEKETIIDKLVWTKNNKNGDQKNPDRGILRCYPYFTFEVNLNQMHKTLSKIRQEALKNKYPYDRLGLIHHNCCTYAAEQLEEMGINLRYRKSYNLYFTDQNLKRLVDSYAIGNDKRIHMYRAEYVKNEHENKDNLPLVITNRSNLYRVLKTKAQIEAEKEAEREKEKARKEAEAKRKAEERIAEIERKKSEEAKDYFKSRKNINYLSDIILPFSCNILLSAIVFYMFFVLGGVF